MMATAKQKVAEYPLMIQQLCCALDVYEEIEQYEKRTGGKMKRGNCICECSHWSDRHKEEWNEETDESFHPCNYRSCDCDDFRPDDQMMRDLENEAKQLRYDAERGK